MTTIAEKIKSRRIDKDLTQQAFADLLNVSRSTVSNWETNRNYPDLDTLVKISDLLDISLDNLLREEEKMVNEITNEVKKSSKRKWILRVVVPLFILSLVITTHFVIQDVSAVRDVLFPKEMVLVEVDNEASQWNTIYVEDKDYFIFNTIFWDKEIINDGNNEKNIIFRVKDSKGSIVKDNIEIPSGTSIILKELERGEKYFFEMKGAAGRYFISFS
ncbi:helix-turn-helix domain-containing protein [Bacillus solimangrovi]|uniref:HTH cro/C1-type domain-containing protein n=1 Tax=Bacillus solimangrovi TaxID=1305675 RepID=A0A1E5LAI1_9BACI|nr:helix-turn-helix domain-containing protein [Bacillus solimangrovi]OEH91080.1 hypothetical protein BFG57_06830 [Bacillus solimangrovi]